MNEDPIRARVFRSKLNGHWYVRVMRGRSSLAYHVFPSWKTAIASALYIVKDLA